MQLLQLWKDSKTEEVFLDEKIKKTNNNNKKQPNKRRSKTRNKKTYQKIITQDF